MAEQRELASLPLMPGLGEKWVDDKIRPKWQKLMVESDAWEESREEILSLLGRLKKAMWLGTNEDLACKIEHLPMISGRSGRSWPMSISQWTNWRHSIRFLNFWTTLT